MDDYDFSVIHLERSVPRRKNVSVMKQQIPNLYVHKAVDGKKLSAKDIQNYQQDGHFPSDVKYDHVCKRLFTKQHLAIWLSHVQLWEHILNKPDAKPYHIIFEDDVTIQPEFMDLLQAYSPRLKKMEFAHLYVHPYQIEQQLHLKRKGVYRVKPGLWGTLCYMIPHNRLEWMLAMIKPLQTAIDEQVTRLKMKSYYIYDNFVTHGSLPSENKYMPPY